MDSEKSNLWEEGVSPLKTIRQLLKLTQKEFAQRIDSDQNIVSRWERGLAEATFTVAQIKALTELITDLGLTWRDMPDSFRPHTDENR
ncbi:helix-turn-helix domain-containing protein [Phormidesmis sp. 146-35]